MGHPVSLRQCYQSPGSPPSPMSGQKRPLVVVAVVPWQHRTQLTNLAAVATSVICFSSNAQRSVTATSFSSRKSKRSAGSTIRYVSNGQRIGPA
eukprot:1646561-Rhodomonas_salina.2